MIGKNNPLNVRFNPLNHWRGQTGSIRGFCDFCEEYYGVRAAMYLLFRSYKKKNCVTYAEMIERYAPSKENNTKAYINFICKHMHVFPFDVPHHFNEWIDLFYYMSIYEGNAVSANKIEKYFYEFLDESKR